MSSHVGFAVHNGFKLSFSFLSGMVQELGLHETARFVCKQVVS